MGYDVALVEEYLRTQANIHSPLLSEKKLINKYICIFHTIFYNYIYICIYIHTWT